jgi:deazaflavin-dependent oxidoreductase (nitroreductase family)
MRVLLRLPIGLYRVRLGWLLGGRFVLIEHRGRRTGQPRETVVEVVARDRGSGAVTVASGFGPRADWYQNLLAQPEATVQIGGHRFRADAVNLSPAQAGAAMLDYAHRHPFAARRLCRFMGFDVNGSDDDYRDVAARVPFLRLQPR